MLPAEMTTTMPARVARSTACTIGSVAAGSQIGWPSDRFITSIPSAALLTVAKSIAAMTSLLNPPPVASSTFRPISRAPWATPLYCPPDC
jgi:hypothetical protein